MSQLAASEGQPRFSGGGAGLFLRRLETVKSQEECWQERYDGRLSRTDLWGRGGEIPLRYPTLNFAQTFDTGKKYLKSWICKTFDLIVNNSS